MNRYELGAAIKIPCSIGPGAFVGEHYVTIPLEGEEVSGFVPRNHLTDIRDASAYISGTIEGISGQTLTLRIPGSFFTTTGVADVSQTWVERFARLT